MASKDKRKGLTFSACLWQPLAIAWRHKGILFVCGIALEIAETLTTVSFGNPVAYFSSIPNVGDLVSAQNWLRIIIPASLSAYAVRLVVRREASADNQQEWAALPIVILRAVMIYAAAAVGFVLLATLAGLLLQALWGAGTSVMMDVLAAPKEFASTAVFLTGVIGALPVMLILAIIFAPVGGALFLAATLALANVALTSQSAVSAYLAAIKKIWDEKRRLVGTASGLAPFAFAFGGEATPIGAVLQHYPMILTIIGFAWFVGLVVFIAVEWPALVKDY